MPKTNKNHTFVHNVVFGYALEYLQQSGYNTCQCCPKDFLTRANMCVCLGIGWAIILSTCTDIETWLSCHNCNIKQGFPSLIL